MSVRCPKCFAASPLSARDIGAAGRMVCCETCGTHWLARNFEGDPFATGDFAGSERRHGAVEDAVVVDHVAPAFVRRAAAAAKAPPRRWLRLSIRG